MGAAPNTSQTHIRIDDQGVAWIDDTNVKVVEVVLDKLAHGLSAEEIYREHDRHLSLAQIHAALAYYYDHQRVLDAENAERLRQVEELQAKTPESPLMHRLRAEGRLN